MGLTKLLTATAAAGTLGLAGCATSNSLHNAALSQPQRSVTQENISVISGNYNDIFAQNSMRAPGYMDQDRFNTFIQNRFPQQYETLSPRDLEQAKYHIDVFRGLGQHSIDSGCGDSTWPASDYDTMLNFALGADPNTINSMYFEQIGCLTTGLQNNAIAIGGAHPDIIGYGLSGIGGGLLAGGSRSATTIQPGEGRGIGHNLTDIFGAFGAN